MKSVTLSGLLTLIFITLKLVGSIDWPWLWVLSPVWAPSAILIIVAGTVWLWATIHVTFFSTPKQREQMKRIREDQKRNAGKSKWQLRIEAMHPELFKNRNLGK